MPGFSLASADVELFSASALASLGATFSSSLVDGAMIEQTIPQLMRGPL